MARGGDAARGRAHRRTVAGRLRRGPARRDDAGRRPADLRGPGALLRTHLPDAVPARLGARRDRPAGRHEYQGHPTARTHLRRRQDAYAGDAAPPRARPGRAAGPARGGAFQVARRHAAAAGARGRAQLRQARRGKRNAGARPARGSALAAASVERARLSTGGRGRGARPARRRRRGRTRHAARGAAVGRAAVAAAGRRPVHPGADRRSPDVRARESRARRRVAHPVDRFLPIPVSGRGQGGPLRPGRVAARLRPGEERSLRQGTQRTDLRDPQPAARRRRATRAEGGRGRGAAPPLLRDRVDRRPRRLPPARHGRGGEHRRDRRDRPQGPDAGGGPLPAQFPLPSRPDGHLLYALDATRRVPAHARDSADVRHRAARRRTVGRGAAGRAERVPAGPRTGGRSRSGARVDRHRHARGDRGAGQRLDVGLRGRVGQGAQHSGRAARAEVPGDGTGGVRGVPEFAAHRAEGAHAGRGRAGRGDAARPHRTGQGAAALDRTVLVSGRSRIRRRPAGGAQGVAAGQPAEPETDAPRRVRQPGDGGDGRAETPGRRAADAQPDPGRGAGRGARPPVAGAAARRRERRGVPLRRAGAAGRVRLGQAESRGAALPRRDDRPRPPAHLPQRGRAGGTVARRTRRGAHGRPRISRLGGGARPTGAPAARPAARGPAGGLDGPGQTTDSRSGPPCLGDRGDRQRAERRPRLQAHGRERAAVSDRAGRFAGADAGHAGQPGGPAAGRPVRPVARGRAGAPGEGSGRRVRRESAAAQDAAAQGGARHHRPRRARGGVRRRADPARRLRQDVVAHADRRGRAQGTHAGGVPARTGGAAGTSAGGPGPGRAAGPVGGRVGHGSRRGGVLHGRPDGRGAARRL